MVPVQRSLRKYALEIEAACYRTEKAPMPRTCRESAGESARKKVISGRIAGGIVGRPLPAEKQRYLRCPNR